MDLRWTSYSWGPRWLYGLWTSVSRPEIHFIAFKRSFTERRVSRVGVKGYVYISYNTSKIEWTHFMSISDGVFRDMCNDRKEDFRLDLGRSCIVYVYHFSLVFSRTTCLRKPKCIIVLQNPKFIPVAVTPYPWPLVSSREIICLKGRVTCSTQSNAIEASLLSGEIIPLLYSHNFTCLLSTVFSMIYWRCIVIIWPLSILFYF